jgi:hypothetical protein
MHAVMTVLMTCVIGTVVDRTLSMRGRGGGGAGNATANESDDGKTFFDEARARAIGRALESGGARPTGSLAERSAFGFLETALDDLRRDFVGEAVRDGRREETTRVEIVGRTHSGDAGDEWTTTYANLTSLGLRVRDVRGRENGYAERAIVLSAHVDTVHSSPGGCDNGANIAIALETTRALLARIRENDQTFTRDGMPAPGLCDENARRCAAVIVIFSAAEEEGLVGAYGLTRTHEWFNDVNVPVQAILNLESMGAGGPHRLFQVKTDTSVGRSALKMWARVSPRASGNVLAEDIFNSGLINSGTDYAVFRDYSDARVMFDFAFVEKTTVYHTPRDRMKFVRPGSLRSSGDNLLEFMSAFCALGGFGDDDDGSAHSRRPTSWYTIPGYGMVVHDAPDPENHLAFVGIPLAFCAAVLHQICVGPVSLRASAEAARDRSENMFRLMITILVITVGSVIQWFSAVTAAAMAPVVMSYVFDAPDLYVARPVALLALSGSAAFIAMMIFARAMRRAVFSVLPMHVKLTSGVDAERTVEWSLLFGQTLVWGGVASRAVRASVGSSYIPLIWMMLPMTVAIVPPLLPMFTSKLERVPKPPSPARLVATLVFPLWITFPNALVLLHVLQGVGARSPVGNDMIFLYDAISGAIVGLMTIAVVGFFAPTIAGGESARWRSAMKIGAGTLASSAAYTFVFMTINRGVNWTVLSPQPVILTHLARSSRGDGEIIIARAGVGRMRHVVNALKSNPEIDGAYDFDCARNKTVDFVSSKIQGACVVTRKNDKDALAEEVRNSGASAPSFSQIEAIGADAYATTMHVGESLRWVLAIDKRCVSRIAVSAKHDADASSFVEPNPLNWVNIETYRPGHGQRAHVNGIGGVSAPMEYVVWYTLRDEEERMKYFGSRADVARHACASGVRVRVDYTVRTPSLAAIDKALPRWTAPFGKHKSPQWLSFFEHLDVVPSSK